MKIVFIADVFANDIVGGGELNNEEFIRISGQDNDVVKMYASHINLDFLKNNGNAKYIIANFISLSVPNLNYITENLDYIIYEHDHKYLASRNPAFYKDFLAPKEKIINFQFYKNAIAVLAQSNFHKDIIEKNLGLKNIINLSGNLWSEESLILLEKYAKKSKKDGYSVMDSDILHKNTREAVAYCQYKGIPYDLVSHDDYHIFLDKLSDNRNLVFFPKTPETLSRLVVEARMMGMSLITNKIIGATNEEWFSLKGVDLIQYMRHKRGTIVNTILEAFNNENPTSNK